METKADSKSRIDIQDRIVVVFKLKIKAYWTLLIR